MCVELGGSNLSTPSLTRRLVLNGLGLAGTSLAFPAQLRASTAPLVKVARSAGCGCCLLWGKHLEANGFRVEMTERKDMTAYKTSLGIPPALESCHTGLIDGYVIEGHVPAEAITRLLAQKPTAIGLSVPGMPIGSPGMEGGTPEIYEVILFSKTGVTSFGRWKGSAAV